MAEQQQEHKQQGITKYVASDGVEVSLTKASVAKYILTGNSQVSDRELVSFMAKCKARRLNPFAGDAYMTCFNGRASVVVSKDYFVRTANQQPSFDGFKAGVAVWRGGEIIYREGCIVSPSQEQLIGGWAEVYDKNHRVPLRAEVMLDEYNTGKALWASKPATMIRKVALVQALREAYPGSYGGIYDSDEMPEPDNPTINIPEPIQVQEPVIEEEPEPVVEPAEEFEASPDMYDADVDF